MLQKAFRSLKLGGGQQQVQRQQEFEDLPARRSYSEDANRHRLGGGNAGPGAPCPTDMYHDAEGMQSALAGARVVIDSNTARSGDMARPAAAAAAAAAAVAAAAKANGGDVHGGSGANKSPTRRRFWVANSAPLPVQEPTGGRINEQLLGETNGGGIGSVKLVSGGGGHSPLHRPAIHPLSALAIAGLSATQDRPTSADRARHRDREREREKEGGMPDDGAGRQMTTEEQIARFKAKGSVAGGKGGNGGGGTNGLNGEGGKVTARNGWTFVASGGPEDSHVGNCQSGGHAYMGGGRRVSEGRAGAEGGNSSGSGSGGGGRGSPASQDDRAERRRCKEEGIGEEECEGEGDGDGEGDLEGHDDGHGEETTREKYLRLQDRLQRIDSKLRRLQERRDGYVARLSSARSRKEKLAGPIEQWLRPPALPIERHGGRV